MLLPSQVNLGSKNNIVLNMNRKRCARVWTCWCMHVYVPVKRSLKETLLDILQTEDTYIDFLLSFIFKISSFYPLYLSWIVLVFLTINYSLSLNGLWANSSRGWRLKAEWAIDSEAKRARRIILLVKSNWMVINIETKQL